MPTIRVSSPVLDGGLVLDWKDKKVFPVQKSPEARAEWDYLQSRGLHGKYGHYLDPEDCWFTDLVIAIAVRVGRGNYVIDTAGDQQLKLEQEIENRNPLPEGAVY
jgi:hypothetical protein